jgi:hypothetical protein
MTEGNRSHSHVPDATAPDAAAGSAVARRPMARAAASRSSMRCERISRGAGAGAGRAEVISEGQRGVRNGRDAYFGSTMLTIDLPP